MISEHTTLRRSNNSSSSATSTVISHLSFVIFSNLQHVVEVRMDGERSTVIMIIQKNKPHWWNGFDHHKDFETCSDNLPTT